MVNYNDIDLTGLDRPTIEYIKSVLEKRIEAFWKDLKTGHITRVVEGIDQKYADENQALIVFDHLARVRCYQEILADLNIALANTEGKPKIRDTKCKRCRQVEVANKGDYCDECWKFFLDPMKK